MPVVGGLYECWVCTSTRIVGGVGCQGWMEGLILHTV